MTSEMLLDYLGILINGEETGEFDYKINLVITDTKEEYYLHLYHGTLLYAKGSIKDPDATLTMPRLLLLSIIQNDDDKISKIDVDGDKEVLDALSKHLVEYPDFFNLIEP